MRMMVSHIQRFVSLVLFPMVMIGLSSDFAEATVGSMPVMANYSVVGTVAQWTQYLSNISGIASDAGTSAGGNLANIVWTATGDTTRVFVHKEYVVVYLRAVKLPDVDTTVDRSAVQIWAACPFQYSTFVASPTAVVPVCVQASPLLVVRQYLLDWITKRLQSLSSQNVTLFRYESG